MDPHNTTDTQLITHMTQLAGKLDAIEEDVLEIKKTLDDFRAQTYVWVGTTATQSQILKELDRRTTDLEKKKWQVWLATYTAVLAVVGGLLAAYLG